GTEKAGRVDHEWRQDFRVAVVTRMNVEHEVDQGAFEQRADAPVNGKARTGDFGGTLQVQNAELGAKVPVRLGFEIELTRLAPAPDLDVVLLAFADGHGFVGNVGYPRQHLLERCIESLHLFGQGLYAVVHRA